jgi:hypothetical protein
MNLPKTDDIGIMGIYCRSYKKATTKLNIDGSSSGKSIAWSLASLNSPSSALLKYKDLVVRMSRCIGNTSA